MTWPAWVKASWIDRRGVRYMVPIAADDLAALQDSWWLIGRRAA